MIIHKIVKLFKFVAFANYMSSKICTSAVLHHTHTNCYPLLLRTSPIRSKESDTVNYGTVEKPSHRARPTSGTTTTAAANFVFKNVSLVEQGADEIESYSSSSEDVPANPSSITGGTLIDYKNQFSANSASKVSKELLTEDNDAYLLTRKKKWMTAKKGRNKRWKRFKARGKGKNN